MNHALDKYLSNIRKSFEGYPKEILEACCNIVIQIFKYNILEINYLTFSRLYSWSGMKSHLEFKEALYILIDPNLKILDQHFEAFNVRKNRYEGIDINFVYEILISKDYIDPFTFESISESDFNNIINIFFALSEDFKRVGLH
ncbi:hypothetical protein M5F04_14975 [Acinetobacter sp. ANC 7200]|uniref:hypothetical protein n=1 Tax=Acinetobacter amyesii TaxID=2942470 RepID=UPI0020BFF93D|nr:hypothetical protein [Acinetobacter amyesii]MCL6245837.1 hypothetical protein [Acinetobacter amyesii]